MDNFGLLYTFSKRCSSLGLMQEKAPYNKEAASRKATYETAKKKYDSKDSKVKFRANCRISIRLDSTVEMVLFSFVCHLSPHN